MPYKPGPICLLGVASLTLASISSPVIARPGPWGQSRWDGPQTRTASESSRRDLASRSREGRIQVNRFVAEGKTGMLGHGPIAVTSNSGGDEFTGERERAPFEAAVIDRLVHAGYETAATNASSGQVAELRVIRSVVAPSGPRHKPVSGEAAMEVSNRGTAYGMAIAVDLTKPPPPLISTRLEARIRDKASGEVLWEGRADVDTREGDSRWTDQEVASRLAEALFDGFPLKS